MNVPETMFFTVVLAPGNWASLNVGPCTITFNRHSSQCEYYGGSFNPCSVISATLVSLRLKRIEHAHWLQAGFISWCTAVTSNTGHTSRPDTAGSFLYPFQYSSKLISSKPENCELVTFYWDLRWIKEWIWSERPIKCYCEGLVMPRVWNLA